MELLAAFSEQRGKLCAGGQHSWLGVNAGDLTQARGERGGGGSLWKRCGGQRLQQQ